MHRYMVFHQVDGADDDDDDDNRDRKTMYANIVYLANGDTVLAHIHRVCMGKTSIFLFAKIKLHGKQTQTYKQR
jgi:hypothetical protein